MTDINELTANLKAAAQELGGEAWHYARPSIYGRGYIINGAGQTVVCTSDGDVPANCARFIETSCPANILALTEALEAALRANAAQDDHINQQQDRIDQLENGHNEAAKHINSWRRLAKQNIAEREKDIAALADARQRIAELEARTLTVKLPDYRGSYKEAFASEVEHHVRIELGKLAAAAGIKLQIQGGG